MSDERTQFLAAYDRHRVTDQAGWYERRAEEYERSARQIGWLNETLLFVAGACGAIAVAWPDHAVWLGVVAAASSALAGVAISWANTVGFAANAELFQSARAGLAHVRPTRPLPPDPVAGGDDSGTGPSDEAVADYMERVEEILLGEVRTWAERWGTKAEDSGP